MQRICKHCQISFDMTDKPKGWMANHSRWCEHNPKRADYVNGSKKSILSMNNARKLNPDNSNQFTKAKSQGVDLHHSDETRLKISNSLKGFRHSTETKLKLSKIKSAWLLENPDKHPWKNCLKFKSAPCEHLKDLLRSQNIEFLEEYSPILSRAFSCDIVFLNKRVIFEVNGNQHYSDIANEVLASYYQERHDLISSEGWDIVEIPYHKVFDSTYIDSLIRLKLSPVPASAF